MSTDDTEYGQPPAAPTRFPGVRAIIIATAAVFLMQQFGGAQLRVALDQAFALSVQGVLGQGRIWQLLTYQLLHGSWLHILLNLFMLYSFGRDLEAMLGTRRLVLLYAASGVLGGLGWLVLSGGSGAHCIGASGAVFGVAAAFAAIEPARKLSFIIFPIPVPITLRARTWVLVGAGVTMAMLLFSESRTAQELGWHDNVAHAAHLLGGVAGYIYGRAVRMRVRLGLSLDAPAPAPRETRPDPDEINRILEKIKERGIDSLSHREREVLERANRGGG